MTKEWEEIKAPSKFGLIKDTGVELKVLKDIGDKITTLPDDWKFHDQIVKIFKARKDSIE